MFLRSQLICRLFQHDLLVLDFSCFVATRIIDSDIVSICLHICNVHDRGAALELPLQSSGSINLICCVCCSFNIAVAPKRLIASFVSGCGRI